MAISPVIVNLSKVMGHGDVLILVPALIAPLYLLSIALLYSSPPLRTHQWTIFILSGGLAAATLLVYVTKIANNVADTDFLVGCSKYAFVFAFALLYGYFLQTHLDGSDAVHPLQESNAALGVELERLRGEEKA